MTDIAALRDRVQGLTGAINLHDKPVWLREVDDVWPGRTRFSINTRFFLVSALCGNLDGAERFRELVLPGSRFSVECDSSGPMITARIYGPGNAEAGHPSEPIARVLAVLNALLAVQK
jgi:hypothetical protein